MAIDTNEIGGFISECTNVDYLRGLQFHIADRLSNLGAERMPSPVVEPRVSRAPFGEQPREPREAFEPLSSGDSRAPGAAFISSECAHLCKRKEAPATPASLPGDAHEEVPVPEQVIVAEAGVTVQASQELAKDQQASECENKAFTPTPSEEETVELEPLPQNRVGQATPNSKPAAPPQ